MESALTYTLQRFDWQFFGTLTFKSARLPERVRVSMWFALVRTICSWFKIRFEDVGWILRQESGEQTGRVHFHFLIVGLPADTARKATAMSIMKQWEKIGGGMARVREFKSADRSVDYILKCLNAGSNLYETTKFSSSGDGVMVANTLWDGRLLARSSVRL